MELDKRIKNNHRPLSVIDIKWAMGFIGKNGFFADAINCFENLSECQNGLLISVKDKKLHPFECDNRWNYTFFIPEEWVEPKEKKYRPYTLAEWVDPKEKKYRPYTLAEWVDHHEIGDVIHYRCKSEGIEFRNMYMGYAFGEGKDITKANVGTVTLGVANYSFDYLFEDYEIEIDGKWQPFGVISNLS